MTSGRWRAALRLPQITRRRQGQRLGRARGFRHDALRRPHTDQRSQTGVDSLSKELHHATGIGLRQRIALRVRRMLGVMRMATPRTVRRVRASAKDMTDTVRVTRAMRVVAIIRVMRVTTGRHTRIRAVRMAVQPRVQFRRHRQQPEHQRQQRQAARDHAVAEGRTVGTTGSTHGGHHGNEHRFVNAR